ncbi:MULTISPECIES: hypothetical protein [unclassified Pseudomonas]|nr:MULTISPECIES: hypothetical protein [unclassified Pseudomonas]
MIEEQAPTAQARPPSAQWHPLFQAALGFLRGRLLGAGGDA